MNLHTNKQKSLIGRTTQKATSLLYGLSAAFLLAALLGLYSCSPSVKKVSMPAPISSSALSYTVTQNPDKDNEVYLESKTSAAIPFWDYGSGTSTKGLDTIIYPFSGDYTIHYSVSSAGGFVMGDSTTIHVTSTDLSYLTDPSWGFIAGATGKTWVLDMARPVGWYGSDYAKHNGSADDWSWHPDYAGNEWVMASRDYGSMHFDLNNGKNYSVTFIDADGKTTTKTGTFDINTSAGTIKLNGAELLYGGDYHGQASNWQNIAILDMSDTSITLGVWRDQPNPGDGPCWIGFTYKLKN